MTSQKVLWIYITTLSWTIEGSWNFFSSSSTQKEEPWVMVAAIDFGTTFSGYGFSFKTSPSEVISNKNWGGEMGTTSYKTPTSVLVDDKGQFVAFGYQAEHLYSQMCLTDEDQGYELYRNFKMMLYHEKALSRNTVIKSTRGKTCKAIKIFAMALKYMKDHLLDAVAKQVDSQPDESLIKWVITIPAIWNDKAKQFMREAAFVAGLVPTKDSKQLLFALEPEAASVLCRNLEVDHFRVQNTGVDVKLPPGTKYMVIDAGGGTIDIAAHEVLPGDHMREIAHGSGGDWGGNQVNQNFIQLLTNILGGEFIEVFKIKYPSAWLELMTNFELNKKATSLGTGSGIRLQLSWPMIDTYRKVIGLDILDTIEASSHEGVSFRGGYLIISVKAVKALFNPVVENIINHVESHLEANPQLANVDYFLLVGGFSESTILYERFQRVFSSIAPVISPHSAGLAIIKGAVMFGHNPKTVIERIARKTYGKSMLEPFDHEKHDLKKLFMHEEKRIEYSKDVFQLLVQKGEVLKIDSVKTVYTTPLYTTFTSASTGIFTSDRVDMIHTDEPGIEKIGSLTIDIPLSKSERTIETKVHFGLTEIEVEYTDASREDGDTKKISIDFLTDNVQYEDDDFTFF